MENLCTVWIGQNAIAIAYKSVALVTRTFFFILNRKMFHPKTFSQKQFLKLFAFKCFILLLSKCLKVEMNVSICSMKSQKHTNTHTHTDVHTFIAF